MSKGITKKDDLIASSRYEYSVSIVIPCRNEEGFIGKCLDSIIANDYPKDLLDVLVVDGESNDRTKQIVEGYVKKYTYIKILINSKKEIPFGLNVGIKEAKGDFIIRMDAHSTYERDYIKKCIKYIRDYSADRVGGCAMTHSRDQTLIGKSIAISLSLPFGVGNSRFRTSLGDEPVWVDTVPFWCCRRELFNEVGLFNENLSRSEDIEFSLRAKRKGFKTLLVPDIVSKYYARSDLKSFWRHNFLNGVWAILPFMYTTDVPVSLRHLVPLLFVIGLITFGVVSFFIKSYYLFLFMLGSYIFVNLSISAMISFRERSLKYFLVMPVIFGALHFSYGLGSLAGLFKVINVKLFGGNKCS